MKLICQLLTLLVTVAKLNSESVKYLLYTQKNPSSPQELLTGDLNSVKASNFDATLPTKILIHGWDESEKKFREIRVAYLAVGNYNVISVDWEKHASADYAKSSFTVAAVGKKVAQFIDFLNERAALAFKDLVVVGYSLGAHVAGYVGKFVTRGRLPYIVGLDPTFAMFSHKEPHRRLNSTDAEYVITVQTNIGQRGSRFPIGNASFYPNWGIKQPGCIFNHFDPCGHRRSVLFYAEAIKGTSYTPVYKCPSLKNILKKEGCNEVVQGLDLADPTQMMKTKGIFYFSTSRQVPFGHKK